MLIVDNGFYCLAEFLKPQFFNSKECTSMDKYILTSWKKITLRYNCDFQNVVCDPYLLFHMLSV